MKAAILGHRGMVGQALMRKIPDAAITMEDLTCIYGARRACAQFADQRVDTVICAAGLVGGIQANSARPVDFGRVNLLIAINAIELAASLNATMVYLGSSCIYPRNAEQPIREEALGVGGMDALEPTNEAYAWAKLTGMNLCRWYQHQRGLRWLTPMPTNLYGPGDNYDPERSHMVAALIRRFHEAKVARLPYVEVWGSGNARREFMHVDDCADAIVHLISVQQRDGYWGVVNVGTGFDHSIRETAYMVSEVIGYKGDIRWDTSKPEGTPRKLLDVGRLRATGWDRARPLRDGLEDAYRAFLARYEKGAAA